LLAGAVLGLSAYFASIFLPNLHSEFLSILPDRDSSFADTEATNYPFFLTGEYTIYSLVVASLTVLMLILFLTL
jgi:hypothetical protein